jgi:hypothetical protein
MALLLHSTQNIYMKYTTNVKDIKCIVIKAAVGCMFILYHARFFCACLIIGELYMYCKCIHKDSGSQNGIFQYRMFHDIMARLQEHLKQKMSYKQ